MFHDIHHFHLSFILYFQVLGGKQPYYGGVTCHRRRGTGAASPPPSPPARLEPAGASNRRRIRASPPPSPLARLEPAGASDPAVPAVRSASPSPVGTAARVEVVEAARRRVRVVSTAVYNAGHISYLGTQLFIYFLFYVTILPSFY